MIDAIRTRGPIYTMGKPDEARTQVITEFYVPNDHSVGIGAESDEIRFLIAEAYLLDDLAVKCNSEKYTVSLRTRQGVVEFPSIYERLKIVEIDRSVVLPPAQRLNFINADRPMTRYTYGVVTNNGAVATGPLIFEFTYYQF